MRLSICVTLMVLATLASVRADIDWQACDVTYCTSCVSKPFVVNGGAYTNILVVIDSNITYDATILPRLKAYIENASQALFRATERVSGRYFGEVTFLIPDHWPQQTECSAASNQWASQATFLVKPDGNAWKSNPYTDRSEGACGSPGERIVLPLSYVTSDSERDKFGHVGKALLHEWAHHRYGLFDESEWENGGDPIYCETNGDGSEIIPRCNNAISGNKVSHTKPGYCVFVPNAEQDTADASIMYAQYISHVDQFCDDTTDSRVLHNKDSASAQNRICSLQSAWTVMRKHSDFHSSIMGATSAQPVNFECYHDNHPRIAIVMDISGSMAGDRMAVMIESVEAFLRTLFFMSKLHKKDIAVGLVSFSTTARTEHSLVMLNSNATLQSLINAIPRATEGSTCIGCGILEGLEVLGEKGKRGVLYVFTDGQENVAPNIEDTRDCVCEWNATVNGIIMGTVATDHPLIDLANDTCGISCMYDDYQYVTMAECMWNVLEVIAPSLVPTQLQGYNADITAGGSLTDSVAIDATLSSNVILRFAWPASQAISANMNPINEEKNNQGTVFDLKKARQHMAGYCDRIYVHVTTASGTLIQPGSPGYVNDGLSVEILTSSNTAGSWSYSVFNPSSRLCDVRVTVEAIPADSEPVIELKPTIPKTEVHLNPTNPPEANSIPLYASLRKGDTPVINARVLALVMKGTTSWTVELWDNGAGADFKANDGVYSRYFTEYNSDGTYSIRFTAENIPGETQLHFEERSYGSGAPPMPEFRVMMTSSSIIAEAFERSDPGSYVQVYGYSSLPPTTYPPSKITDLSGLPEDVQQYNVTLNVTWTATGNNLDKGTASYYDMRISANITELNTNFNTAARVDSSMIISGNLNAPKTAGLQEIFRLNLENTIYNRWNVPYHLAIKAVNTYGDASDVSKIATFKFSLPSVCPPEKGGCVGRSNVKSDGKRKIANNQHNKSKLLRKKRLTKINETNLVT